MPSTAARSNYSSCSFFKNALTPKVLFLTLIVSIALTIRAENTSKEHCFICSSIKVFVKTTCGIMDIFIMFIKQILNKIVTTKSKFDMLLQSVRCKTMKKAFQLPDDKIERNFEIKQPTVNGPPTIRRKTLSIEEHRESVTTRNGPRREPGPSNDEQRRDSFVASSPQDAIELRPSRTKPIPSFVVIPRISLTVSDIANDMKNQETTELEEKNVEELEEEVAKESEPIQDPGTTRVWRSESLDGPKELFELTRPVPIYAEDGLLLGYDDGRGGIMQWDSELGGHYVDENGDVIPLDDKLFRAAFSPEKSDKDLMQKSILKDGAEYDYDDSKKRVTLTFSDEEWAANCNCTDDEEIKKVPTISESCIECVCDKGTIGSTPSSVHWAPDCKCNVESKTTVSMKSIQAPQEELKEESVAVPQVELSVEPEVPEEIYTGPWRSESLDGPKQLYKGEGGGFTKQEEEEYFRREGKCSRYDDNKCKRCRCYRMKFSREQFNNQANLYKGCLANTGMKRKRRDSVRLSKSQPLETSLGRSPASSKVLSSDLKSIRSIGQSLISSGSSAEERCRCNSTTSESKFRSTDCRCPSSASKNTGSVSQRSLNEDRCRCFDTSKTKQRLNEMNNKGDDCKCSNTDSKLSSSFSQRSSNDNRCHCLDSDNKHMKSEISFKSLNEIRCHCHDDSDAKLIKSEARGKDCKCSVTDSKQSNSATQPSLNNNNRCHCHDPTDTKRVKSETLQRSKDCKCPSSDSKLKSLVLRHSVKDYPCQCHNKSDTNRIKSEMFYKKSKDCSCLSTVSNRSSPISNIIVSEPQHSNNEPCCKTTDAECLTEGLCCQRKRSAFSSAESNIASVDSKQTRTGSSTSSGLKTISTRLTDPKHPSAYNPVAKIFSPDPKALGGKNDEFDAEFTGLRAVKHNIPIRTIPQQHQRTQIGGSLEEFVKEQKRMERFSISKKKKDKKKNRNT